MNLSRISMFTGVLLAVLPGCQGSSAPPDPGAAADQQILHALDCCNPMYQIDEDGRVIRLRLDWRHLPVPVMALIGKLTELQELGLAHTTVTDEGLAQLKDLQNLRSLGLSSTPVTDRGLDHLEKLSSLQWVWLSKKTISAAAVEKLRNARPEMHVEYPR